MQSRTYAVGLLVRGVYRINKNKNNACWPFDGDGNQLMNMIIIEIQLKCVRDFRVREVVNELTSSGMTLD